MQPQTCSCVWYCPGNDTVVTWMLLLLLPVNACWKIRIFLEITKPCQPRTSPQPRKVRKHQANRIKAPRRRPPPWRPKDAYKVKRTSQSPELLYNRAVTSINSVHCPCEKWRHQRLRAVSHTSKFTPLLYSTAVEDLLDPHFTSLRTTKSQGETQTQYCSFRKKTTQVVLHKSIRPKSGHVVRWGAL